MARSGTVLRPSAAGEESLVALGRALCDPVRAGMLLALAREGGSRGICVCELVERFGMGQSRISYHLGRLREAGLVREERRGKWSYYSLDREAAGALLGAAGRALLGGEGR
ncbi:transcriptional regulator, ArsR family [Rubrobacter xylanophilus DSM 9941]|uniref:Transcriptional regulator, ArsR family n=1 Tax=Rubrobacter xylanophilus (strain DSM 9941 / JCM 11954 / NBRC 16129 / PRD-1) TaxID=266117 RepID=Q1AS38_RUBXD|nr:metalloregulator ArsR/SmtB family transcription factor [Rubrobacter xylanophilus]ABG05790.1 transcriptional regulator, ArsR family [Rubrobacter xylanophilus DSM 9941]